MCASAGGSDAPPVRETTDADFYRVVDANLKSAFFTVAASLDLLAEDASVILASSAAHDRGKLGDPLYTAVKAAVRSRARSFAADTDLLARRVRVNALSPGSIRTPMTTSTDPAMAKALEEWAVDQVPMRRWGTPEEAARAALYLASADSTYTTGADISVDGGLAQL